MEKPTIEPTTPVRTIVSDFTTRETPSKQEDNDKAHNASAMAFDYAHPPQPEDGPVLKIKKINPEDDLPTVVRATSHSAGMDLFASIFDDIYLNSIGAHAVIPTGISVEIPEGYELQIRPRSGLAANHGITVLNTPGTIDSDYRGEIKVILIKLTPGKLKVQRGMRIAQMVMSPVVFPYIDYVDELTETDRGDGGLGHTGC